MLGLRKWELLGLSSLRLFWRCHKIDEIFFNFLLSLGATNRLLQPIKDNAVTNLLLGKDRLEISGSVHLLQDVQAPDELAVDVQLRVGWPVRVGLQT